MFYRQRMATPACSLVIVAGTATLRLVEASTFRNRYSRVLFTGHVARHQFGDTDGPHTCLATMSDLVSHFPSSEGLHHLTPNRKQNGFGTFVRRLGGEVPADSPEVAAARKVVAKVGVSPRRRTRGPGSVHQPTVREFRTPAGTRRIVSEGVYEHRPNRKFANSWWRQPEVLARMM